MAPLVMVEKWVEAGGIGLNGIVGWMGHIGGAAQNAFHDVHPSKNITNRPLPFSSIRFHLIIYGNKKNHHKMPKDQYMCQLCSNHGHYNQPKKGHKQNCPNRNCTCQLCSLNVKRRVLDQIERQWRLNQKEKKRLMKMKKKSAKNNSIEGGEEEDEAICHVPSPAAKNDNIFGKTIQKLENGRAKMEMAQNGRRRQQHAFHSIELLLAPKAI